jgi:hypothetical protein
MLEPLEGDDGASRGPEGAAPVPGRGAVEPVEGSGDLGIAEPTGNEAGDIFDIVQSSKNSGTN